MLLPILTLTTATFFTWLLTRFRRSTQPRGYRPYPPGPKPDPVIGNARHMPQSHQWKTFADWQKEYGDIIHLEIFGRHVIVLNSYELSHDMLDKVPHYASRPSHPMGDLCDFKNWIALDRDSSNWRLRRRFVSQATSKANTPTFYPGLERGVHTFLKHLLDQPEDWDHDLRLAIGSTIFKSTYGITITSSSDPILMAAEEAAGATGKAIFGAYIVDFLPFLRHLPSPLLSVFPFHRHSVKWKADVNRAMRAPYERVKQMLNSDQANDLPVSMMSSLLEKGTEEDVMFTCGTLFGAATDTTVITLKSFIWGMMLFPDVQRKAQDELDRVLGNTAGEVPRLPTFEDRASLPYIDAIVKESVRWHLAVPLALGHSCEEDTIFQGYLIPKDSIIYPNSWLISRDSQHYPDPDAFKPERFLESETDVLDPYSFIFGFGRRICAGRNYADAQVFIAIAMVLSVFNILPPVGPDGKEVRSPPPEAHAMSDQPIDVRIQPRSDAFAALVRGM